MVRLPGKDAWGYFAQALAIIGPLGGLAFWIVMGHHAAPPPVYVRTIYSLAAATAVLAVACVVFATLYSMQRTQLKRHANYLTIMRELNQVLGIDYLYCTFLRVRGPTASRDELSLQFERYIEECLTHVAVIFGAYTGDTCAACIKVFSKSNTLKVQIDPEIDGAPDDGAVVFTLGRDQHSRYERNAVDEPGSPLQLYSYKYNTAFLRITHDPHFEGYFFGNKLSKNGDYKNARREWDKYYDAVAVASLKNPTNKAVEQAMGFLCVDNKNGGFDSVESREILECLASIVYYSIRSTLAVLKTKSPLEVAV